MCHLARSHFQSLFFNVVDLIDMRQPSLIIDIRPKASYDREHYEDAAHFDISDKEFASLQPYRLKRHIVVIGERVDDAADVANRLVAKHYPFVSMLHGGMDAIRADRPSLLVRKPEK